MGVPAGRNTGRSPYYTPIKRRKKSPPGPLGTLKTGRLSGKVICLPRAFIKELRLSRDSLARTQGIQRRRGEKVFKSSFIFSAGFSLTQKKLGEEKILFNLKNKLIGFSLTQNKLEEEKILFIYFFLAGFSLTQKKREEKSVFIYFF